MQIAEIVFNLLLALHRFEGPLSIKPAAETEAEFIIIGGRRHYTAIICPARMFPTLTTSFPDLRPDNRIFRGSAYSGRGTRWLSRLD